MITFIEFLLYVYIALNIAGCLAFFIGCSVGLELEWETLFNPNEIYKNVKVNRFGAYFLAVIALICITPVAFVFWIYKLCTIGRR